jgi:hypothetical protein
MATNWNETIKKHWPEGALSVDKDNLWGCVAPDLEADSIADGFTPNKSRKYTMGRLTNALRERGYLTGGYHYALPMNDLVRICRLDSGRLAELPYWLQLDVTLAIEKAKNRADKSRVTRRDNADAVDKMLAAFESREKSPKPAADGASRRTIEHKRTTVRKDGQVFRDGRYRG